MVIETMSIHPISSHPSIHPPIHHPIPSHSIHPFIPHPLYIHPSSHPIPSILPYIYYAVPCMSSDPFHPSHAIHPSIHSISFYQSFHLYILSIIFYSSILFPSKHIYLFIFPSQSTHPFHPSIHLQFLSHSSIHPFICGLNS